MSTALGIEMKTALPTVADKDGQRVAGAQSNKISLRNG